MLEFGTYMVLIVVLGSWFLFGMISSKQKLQHTSVIEILAESEEDTVITNTTKCLVDGWHVRTTYKIEVIVAIAGGDSCLALLTTNHDRPNQTGGGTNDLMTLPQAADGGGSGAVVSAMAPVMPSFIFLDPDMGAQATITVRKGHMIEVQEDQSIFFHNTLNDLNNTLTAGTIKIIAIALIIIGSHQDAKGPTGSHERFFGNGADVAILSTDASAIIFGAWQPFSRGRMGNIRMQMYAAATMAEETLHFGPSVGFGGSFPDEDLQEDINPGNEVMSLLSGTAYQEAGYEYSTAYMRGPWKVEQNDNIMYAMAHSEATEVRFIISFHFIPDQNAPVKYNVKWTALEIGTADLEEWQIFPFHMYVDQMTVNLSAVGSTVGVLEALIHFFAKDSSIGDVFEPSATPLEGSLLGSPGAFSRILPVTVKDVIHLPINSLETSSGVFVGSNSIESITEPNVKVDQGSKVGIYVEVADDTVISFMECEVEITGFSRVKSNVFGSDYISSDVIHQEAIPV